MIPKVSKSNPCIQATTQPHDYIDLEPTKYLDLNIERFWAINTQQQIGRKDKKVREKGEILRT